MKRIVVYPAGRTTDWIAAKSIAMLCPEATRKAQHLLMAARKFHNRSGFFSSDTSRLLALQAATYELGRALVKDNYTGPTASHDSLIDFLSLFSAAFPNWQVEYELLSDFIRRT